jgi:glucose/arabinose dehydrogenase/mono/diheme cytochrome c family protein
MKFTAPRIFGLMLPVVIALVGSVMNSRGQSGEFVLFGLTNTWKYNQTVSYDGVNWTAPAFDDSALPGGRGVLALEDAMNPFVTTRTNTALTLGRNTYYFRTHFTFTNHPALASLTFSNVVDDGAVYYLNGVEIARLFMTNNTTAVSYATLAASHDATGFDVFTLSGPVVETNLLMGDNVLAVEVHQTSAGSTDIVFGLALSAMLADTNPPPTLRMPAEPPAFGYQLVNAFPGVTFTDAVAIHTPPGETNRLFVVEQDGRIAVITNLMAPNRTVFLDIVSRVLGGVPTDERGLLGLAFHPGYSTNRKFYVFYTATGTTTQGANALHDRLSQFLVSAGNPNAADAASELVLWEQYDQANNHNGGDLHFGPDGYLYVSLGDEGGGNDQYGNSQLINGDFFSGLMRIDVDNRPGSVMPNPHPANTNNPLREIRYRIPADNPWVGATSFNGVTVNSNTVRTEFYAVGLRNPWRFTFDQLTGELYLADVGQNAWEEVNVVRRGGNYGWNYREGLHAGPRGNPPAGVVLDHPIVEYGRGSGPNQGASVTGGVVYRGARYPDLQGAYIFADYVSGNVWMLRANGTNVVPFPRLTGDGGIAGFGTDPRNGDVLTADQNDDMLKRLVTDTNMVVGGQLPRTLADTGAFTNLMSLAGQTQALTANTGVIPYDVNVPFWSDGARKSRWFFMPTNGAKIGFASESNWSLPAGMAWVKHFDLELTNGEPSSARRLETRILVRTANGTYGVTYRWGNSLTNAALVPDQGLDETFTINDGGILRTQVWHYPSRAECLVCHTPAGGHALAFNTVQLNRDFDYGNGSTNQIAALSRAGYFSAPVTNIHSLRSLAAATNDAVSLEWRVRSYLAANCAQCHQPGGSGLGFWTANISTPTASAGLIGGALNNDYGDTNNRVFVPGSLSNSMMLTRISTRGPGQMPPLASSVLDTEAIQLVRAWITNDLSAYRTFAQWQAANFGSTNAPNAGANFDADSDGASNLAEYIAGTNPLNSNEVWRVSIGSSNGQARINFVQPANRAFEIQWATNLGAPTLWHFDHRPENRPSYPTLPAAISMGEPITNAPFKFYRVKLSQP